MPRPSSPTNPCIGPRVVGSRVVERWTLGSRTLVLKASLATACLIFVAPAAEAQRIENGKAVFAALDKVTARISKLEVKLGETVQFGALKVTPRACFSRPPTEPPKTSTFVEIEEMLLDGKVARIFSGWMFAESPGLNAVEHPVFDVWLTECAEPATAASPQASSAARGAPAAQGGIPPRTRPKR